MLCLLQGKLDPTRRDYYGIFAAMQARAGQLRAANFSLVLVGRGELTLPQDLVEAGLVRQYASLPFQVRREDVVGVWRYCCFRGGGAGMVVRIIFFPMNACDDGWVLTAVRQALLEEGHQVWLSMTD